MGSVTGLGSWCPHFFASSCWQLCFPGNTFGNAGKFGINHFASGAPFSDGVFIPANGSTNTNDGNPLSGLLSRLLIS